MPKVTVTNASQQLISGSGGSRRGLILANISANDIHFRFRSPVTAAGAADAGIPLKAGERLVLVGSNGQFGGPVFLIAPAGNSDLIYEELI
jgi:hypothetical protein